MAMGAVVNFDEVRGYGFVAPDSGGVDVFVHVNDLEFDKRLLEPGARLEFDIEEGDRGPKASQVRIASPVERTRPAAGTLDETECDVLSGPEFLGEVTELLLTSVPALTAEQILVIRRRLAERAREHGWLDS
jgi:CspA family cold shock protein